MRAAFLIFGPRGMGKTEIASGIDRARIDVSYQIVVHTHPRLGCCTGRLLA